MRTLHASTRPNDTNYVDEFTDWVQRYRQRIRWRGGFWSADWFMPGDSKYLDEWFYNRLMFGIQTRVGGDVAWEGVVWQMTLARGGVTERRDMSQLYNAIKVLYTDTSGTDQSTSWVTDASSITQFGRRELILELDDITATEATDAANHRLALSAYPSSEVVAVGANLKPGLQVRAVGRVVTMNNKYVTAGDSTLDNTDAYIEEILDNDCEYVSPGTLETNTRQTKKAAPETARPWNTVQDMVERASSTGELWRFFVGKGGRAEYRKADATPRYEWRGKTLAAIDGNYVPWLVKPAVVRNLSRRQTVPTTSSFFTDGRDFLVGEVEMADDRQNPRLKPISVNEQDIIEAMADYRRWLEEEHEHA